MSFAFLRGAVARVAVLIIGFFAIPAAASADRAQALVEQAIVHYDAVGRDAAFADFMNSDSDWVSGAFYVIVANASDGLIKAHGRNAKLIDNPKLWDLQDVNGRFIMRDAVASGATAPDGGWTEYVWANPATQKLAVKRTFIRVHDEMLFMSGYYE